MAVCIHISTMRFILQVFNYVRRPFFSSFRVPCRLHLVLPSGLFLELPRPRELLEPPLVPVAVQAAPFAPRDAGGGLGHPLAHRLVRT